MTKYQGLTQDAITALEGCVVSGNLDPKRVVEAARYKDSPLHSYFEWDDKKAASAYRIDQARDLIRRVEMVITVKDVPFRAPRWVSEPSNRLEGGGYSELLDIRSDEDRARDVLIDEMKRMTSAIARMKSVAAVLNAEDDLMEIDRQVKRVIEEVSQNQH